MVIYRLVDARMIDAIDLMRAVLREMTARRNHVIESA